MNEQIRTLLRKSGLPQLPIQNDIFLEKFAELVVMECLLQVADVRIENDFEPVGDAALLKALMGIKKHFGVK